MRQSWPLILINSYYALSRSGSKCSYTQLTSHAHRLYEFVIAFTYLRKKECCVTFLVWNTIFWKSFCLIFIYLWPCQLKSEILKWSTVECGWNSESIPQHRKQTLVNVSTMLCLIKGNKTGTNLITDFKLLYKWVNQIVWHFLLFKTKYSIPYWKLIGKRSVMAWTKNVHTKPKWIRNRLFFLVFTSFYFFSYDVTPQRFEHNKFI